jgi:GntR family transcriptional regulator
MEIEINPANDIPIYRQIINQMQCLVAMGLLTPDKVLPSIRSLAVELGVSPNTIVKAYEELEAQGLLRRRRGRGTFVSSGCMQLADAQWRHKIEQKIDALLAEAQRLNLKPAALLELMHRRQAILTRASSPPPAAFAASPRGTGAP